MALASHEVFQDRDFPAGQLQHGTVAGDGAAGWVEGEAASGQQRRPLAEAAPGQCSQVREQDRVGERLGQVVIGSAVQPFGVVEVLIHRGEHQDGGPQPLLAQLPAHLVAVQAGQHHIEDDDVVGCFAGLPQTILAVVGHVHDIALRL